MLGKPSTICLHVYLCEGSPGTGATDSCELPCGCWELNLGPPREQPVLLTAEPSLQFMSAFLKYLKHESMGFVEIDGES